MKSKLRHKRARKAIEASGRSVKWLAIKIGIKPNTLSIYLMGLGQPSFRVVNKLAELVDIDVSMLWIGKIDEEIKG